MTQPKIMVEFEDKYGERRVIHKTRHGLKLKYMRRTVVHVLGPIIAPLVGAEVRRLRRERQMGPDELLQRAGLIAAEAQQKNRMYEIEKGKRKHGVRLATLYALAEALGVEARHLLPPNADVFTKANGGLVKQTTTAVRVNGSRYDDIDPSVERMDVG